MNKKLRMKSNGPKIILSIIAIIVFIGLGMNTYINKNFIGDDSAREIAIDFFGIDDNEIKIFEIKLDFENKKFVYEIEFYANNGEYDIMISAKTGDIIKYEKEEYGTGNSNSSSEVTYISEKEALTIAYNAGNASESDVTLIKVSLEIDDDIKVYEVEFIRLNTKYEYKINAITGEIIEFDTELVY